MALIKTSDLGGSPGVEGETICEAAPGAISEGSAAYHPHGRGYRCFTAYERHSKSLAPLQLTLSSAEAPLTACADPLYPASEAQEAELLRPPPHASAGQAAREVTDEVV